MAAALLTEAEKSRIRTHLGYNSAVAPVASIQLGFPASSQSAFMVEFAMNNLLPEACGYIRKCLAQLDGLDDQLGEAQGFLQVDKVGEITLSESATDRIEKEYVRWAQRLADSMGVPLNPNCARFRHLAGGGPLMLQVRRGC